MKTSIPFAILLLAVALSTRAAHVFSVQFPESTNRVFSVTIDEEGSGQHAFDAYLEYPTEYDEQGRSLETTRRGVGHRIFVTVLDVSDSRAHCRVEAESTALVDWVAYDIGAIIVQQPVFSTLSYKGEIALPIGEWLILGGCGLKNEKPLNWKFKYEKIDDSQQSP